MPDVLSAQLKGRRFLFVAYCRVVDLFVGFSPMPLKLREVDGPWRGNTFLA